MFPQVKFLFLLRIVIILCPTTPKPGNWIWVFKHDPVPSHRQVHQGLIQHFQHIAIKPELNKSVSHTEQEDYDPHETINTDTAS